MVTPYKLSRTRRCAQFVKKTSQSLPCPQAVINGIIFAGACTWQKYFSVCKCGICSLSANKLCARQTASLLSKKGAALFGQFLSRDRGDLSRDRAGTSRGDPVPCKSVPDMV